MCFQGPVELAVEPSGPLPSLRVRAETGQYLFDLLPGCAPGQI